VRAIDRQRIEETAMTPISKIVSPLTISVVLAMSAALTTISPAVAKSGGGPSQVKTSGTSANQGSNPSGGPVARRPAGCGHKTYGACAFPTPTGTQSGNDPRGPNRGPGNPTLHPK